MFSISKTSIKQVISFNLFVEVNVDFEESQYSSNHFLNFFLSSPFPDGLFWRSIDNGKT